MKLFAHTALALALTPISGQHLAASSSNQRKLSILSEPIGTCSFTCIDDGNIVFDEDIDAIKQFIRDDIEADTNCYAGSRTDCIGEYIRLVFHDAASFHVDSVDIFSGLNGCVDLTHAGNAGLNASSTFLENLQATPTAKGLSKADLITLAAIVAIEAAGGPTIPLKYGRKDIPCACEVTHLPSPGGPDGAKIINLDDNMKDYNGFTAREVTALMGAHTVGKMSPQFSGFDGSWVPQSGAGRQNDRFDNFYYSFMLNAPWTKEEKIISGQILTEWRLTNDMMYLNTDGALGFILDDENCSVFGGASGNCLPRTDEYGTAVRDFAANNALWISEFTDAFIKMTEQMAPCEHLKIAGPRPKCIKYVGPFSTDIFNFGQCLVELQWTMFEDASRFPFLRFFDENGQLPTGAPKSWRGTKGAAKQKFFNGSTSTPKVPPFNEMQVIFRSGGTLLEFEVCGDCVFPEF